MPRAVAIGWAVWCGAMAAFAEPPSGLPVIPPSSTFPAPSSAPAPVPPAIPPTPPCGPPSTPVESAAVPSITVGTFDAAGATSFRFGDVEVPGSELARRLALEVGLRLGDASGLRLVDASGGFPAEYALNASVETAGLAETVRTIKASGYVYRDGSASLTAIARLVRRSDGLVVWSDRVRSDLGRESLERLAATGGPLPEATVARLVADAGGRIADEAVDRLVPRAIAAVEGGEIRLNRGSDLAAGIRLRVLAAGASGDDPRTVAILEVRAAGSRPTLAVVEGDASLVVAGLRVRPIASR